MKPLHFVGSALNDIRDFPEEVRSEVGYSLYLAQIGDKAINAIPMVGFGGASVLEVIMADAGGTFRAIYTVRFLKAVYALHAFQKKSKAGASTPRPDMRLIRSRLRDAEDHYREMYEKARKERGHERGA
jgi:phage-related protein